MCVSGVWCPTSLTERQLPAPSRLWSLEGRQGRGHQTMAVHVPVPVPATATATATAPVSVVTMAGSLVGVRRGSGGCSGGSGGSVFSEYEYEYVGRGVGRGGDGAMRCGHLH